MSSFVAMMLTDLETWDSSGSVVESALRQGTQNKTAEHPDIPATSRVEIDWTGTNLDWSFRGSLWTLTYPKTRTSMMTCHRNMLENGNRSVPLTLSGASKVSFSVRQCTDWLCVSGSPLVSAGHTRFKTWSHALNPHTRGRHCGDLSRHLFVTVTTRLKLCSFRRGPRALWKKLIWEKKSCQNTRKMYQISIRRSRKKRIDISTQVCLCAAPFVTSGVKKRWNQATQCYLPACGSFAIKSSGARLAHGDILKVRNLRLAVSIRKLESKAHTCMEALRPVMSLNSICRSTLHYGA